MDVPIEAGLADHCKEMKHYPYAYLMVNAQADALGKSRARSYRRISRKSSHAGDQHRPPSSFSAALQAHGFSPGATTSSDVKSTLPQLYASAGLPNSLRANGIDGQK